MDINITNMIIGKNMEDIYKMQLCFTIRVLIKDNELIKYDKKKISYRCNVETKNNIIVKIFGFF